MWTEVQIYHLFEAAVENVIVIVATMMEKTGWGVTWSILLLWEVIKYSLLLPASQPIMNSIVICKISIAW